MSVKIKVLAKSTYPSSSPRFPHRSEVALGLSGTLPFPAAAHLRHLDISFKLTHISGTVQAKREETYG